MGPLLLLVYSLLAPALAALYAVFFLLSPRRALMKALGGEIARRLHCPDFHLLLPESGKGAPPVKTSVLTETTVNVEGLPLGVRLEAR